MTGTSSQKKRWPGFGLLAVFSLALLLRLLGPMGALPEKDGYVAICTGSEIVYIPIGELTGEDSDEKEAHSESCDWFVQFHAIAAAASPDPAPQALRGLRLRAPQARAMRAARLPHGFHARAPPPDGHVTPVSTLI